MLRWAQRRQRSGQAAVGFIAVMALIVVLTSATMNIGELARLKTATANSADAGALAGASWIASGTNDLAIIAQLMLINYWVLQAIFFVPFCLQLIWMPPMLLLTLMVTNVGLNELTAVPRMQAAWDRGKGSALLTAIANARIDDDSGLVAEEIRKLVEGVSEGNDEVPGNVRFQWTRRGAEDEASWVSFDVRYPPDASMPKIVMESGNLTFWGWIPSCLGIFCWQAFGWNVPGTKRDPPPKPVDPMGGQDTPGKNGSVYVGWVKPVFSVRAPSSIGWCGYTTFLPFIIRAKWFRIPVRPKVILNSAGEVGVTVTQHRDAILLPRWRMRYPEQIVSSAAAEYKGARVKGPFSSGDQAAAQLEPGNIR